MGFIKDTLEKVYRLADILQYFNTNPILKDNLALKGGTAEAIVCHMHRLAGYLVANFEFFYNIADDRLFTFIAHILNPIKNLIIGEIIRFIQHGKHIMTGPVLGTWVNYPVVYESLN